MTGNGTVESPYVIGGSDTKEIWNELLEAIKKPSTYVELDQAYTFDLDEIYGDSPIPNNIPIGYKTVFDGKNSVVTSQKVKWSEDGKETEKTCDFQGSRADILNLQWLDIPTAYGVTSFNTYLVDDETSFLSKCDAGISSQKWNRIKCKSGIIIDCESIQEAKIQDISCGIIQGNGLTFKGGRDFCIRFLRTTSSTTDTYVYDIDMINMNFETSDLINFSDAANTYFHRCHIVSYNLSNGEKIAIRPRGGSYNANFYSCVLEYHNIGSPNAIHKVNTQHDYDCIIKVDGYSVVPQRMYSCYVYGKDCTFYSVPQNVSGTIFEVQSDDVNTSTSGISNINNVVINKTLAPNLEWATNGIALLTTDEIRKGENLYSSGIPIDPKSRA